MKRDTYFIDANVLLSNPKSGIDEIGVVKYPAIELEGITLAEQKQNESVLEKTYFNSEKMQIAGYFSLSDFPIYRRDQDDYEYDLIFSKESTQIMHQKMTEFKLSDGFKINFEHRNNDALNKFNSDLKELGFENGDVPASIYSLDYVDTDIKKDFIKQQYGIELPEKYKDSEGSFMVIQITNSDYFNFLKENQIKSFSLEGFFSKVFQEFKLQNKNKEEKMKKQLFRTPTKKGAKSFFSFEFTKDAFVSQEEILADIPLGTNYAEFIGDDSYADFTGKEEWTSEDGTVFDIVVENGLVTDIIIKEEVETPDADTDLNEDSEKPKEDEETKKEALTEEEIIKMISTKFEEIVQPKIDEVVEMITELRATFEDDKMKEGEETELSKKENKTTNNKEAFNNVIKNYLLRK